jgi:putative permease
MNRTVLPYYAKLAFVLISLVAIGYIAILGKEVLAPLVFSFLFAMLLLPLTRFLENKCRLPRAAAAMVSVILFTGTIVLIGYAVGSQISNLSDDFPALKKQITESYTQMNVWFETQLHINATKQLSKIEKTGADSAGGIISTTVLSISSIVLFLVFIFIYTFFVLLYRKILVGFLLKAFGKDYEILVFDIAEEIQNIMKKYITGLFLEMVIVTAIVFGVLSVIGVKYALLLALITGIFNLIPYVGIFTAMALSSVLTLGTIGPAKALIVAISIIGVHLVDSNVIMPRVVGSKVKLNALMVVLGVVVGEMIWGLSGMFLAIPVIAIVKIIFDRVEDLKPWGLLLGEENEYDNAVVAAVAHESEQEPAIKTDDEI